MLTVQAAAFLGSETDLQLIEEHHTGLAATLIMVHFPVVTAVRNAAEDWSLGILTYKLVGYVTPLRFEETYQVMKPN